MQRRTFLLGGVTGLTVVATAGCTAGTPEPDPTATPSTTGAPTDAPIPAPAGMMRSNWSADPYYRGSASFLGVGATSELRRTLGKPVGDRVFFAGEATSVDRPASVDGAIASGKRAAAEVMAAAEEGERIGILGAGIAGATAARILVDAGFPVTVLEASDRIGGRIDTRRDDAWGLPVELGAWAIQSESGLESELRRLEVDSLILGGERSVRTADGTEVDPQSTGMDAIAAAVAAASALPNDVSLSSALRQVEIAGGEETGEGQTGEGTAGEEPTGEQSESDEPADAAPSEGVPGSPQTLADADWVAGAISDEVEVPYGASGADISASEGVNDGPRGGDRTVFGGFDTLFEEALDGVDVLTSNVVSEISYGDDGVSLRIATGESLQVGRVIVTVPLGVLKRRDIRFEPRLPTSHIVAALRLDMGVADRVWLRFEEPFWTTDATRWSVVGSDLAITEWVNLEPATGAPVLVGLVGAERALALADAGDDEVVELALASLGPFAAVD